VENGSQSGRISNPGEWQDQAVAYQQTSRVKLVSAVTAKGERFDLVLAAPSAHCLKENNVRSNKAFF
jgi:hypothetical protein